MTKNSIISEFETEDIKKKKPKLPDGLNAEQKAIWDQCVEAVKAGYTIARVIEKFNEKTGFDYSYSCVYSAIKKAVANSGKK